MIQKNADPFAPDRRLLNPVFENYKFDSSHTVTLESLAWSSQENSFAARPLVEPDGAKNQTFSWAESRVRARWNHLGISSDSKEIAWIDNQGNLYVAPLNEEKNTIEPKVLWQIPDLDNNNNKIEQRAEYPTVMSSSRAHDNNNDNNSNDVWVISDGFGSLYCVSRESGQLISHAQYILNDKLTPFKLHGVHKNTALISLDLTLPRTDPFHYRICLVYLPTSSTSSSALDSAWSVLGNDVPAYVHYDDSIDMWRIGSTCAYVSPEAAANAKNSSLDVDLDDVERSTPPPPTTTTDINTNKNNNNNNNNNVKPSYTWTQTSETVTINIPLPPSLGSVKNIKIAISSNSLTFETSPPTNEPELEYKDIPHFANEPLWATVDIDGSTWTLERVPTIQKNQDNEETMMPIETSTPVVTIYLDKVYSGTRWPHLFSETSNQTIIPEQLDPDALNEINQSMEKYVTDIPEESKILDAEHQKKMNKAGIGARDDLVKLDQNQKQSNSSTLLGDEIDAEIDTQSPTDQLFFTYLPLDGREKRVVAAERAAGYGQKLVSTSLPDGINSQSSSIIVKRDVDGLVFNPDPSFGSTTQESSIKPHWKHVSTFPALSFVLASKRFLRSTHHIKHSLVIALESGGPLHSISSSSKQYGGNAYLYWAPPPGSRDKTARSAVLSIVNETTGDIVGIQSLSCSSSSSFPSMVAILCEKRLVLMRGFN